MISGITLSSGIDSAKCTARATFAGSCSVETSMSGKRSSKKGVRIPPAITAVTLIPCGRSSACNACDSPSSPHFVAWYADAFGHARLDAVDAMLMMCPRLRLRMRVTA